MKILGLLIISLCVALPAAPPGTPELIDDARSMPPEIAADALIRLAGTNNFDPARKVQLLETGFQRASGAQQPYRRRAALARIDGLAAYWNRVNAQGLDALTLQVRAVTAMLPLDSRKAQELFARIPPVKLPRLTCEEYLVYDVEPFYRLLGEMARAADAPGAFLKPYVAAIASPAQAGPMLRAILAARLSNPDLEAVTNAFAAALGKIGGDDRSFTYSHAVGKDVLDLVDELKRRQLSPLRLIEAYRLYLIWNLSAPRCADNDLMQGGRQSFALITGQPADPQAGDVVNFFNTRLRAAPLQPIGEAEATPARLEGAATGLRMCQDTECRAAVDQLRALLLGPNGIPYRPNERATPEWQAKLRGFLAALDNWKQNAAGTPAGFFREKVQIYSELLNLTADGANRETVMRSLLAFAAAGGMRNTNRLEWFLPINAVIARLSLDPAGLSKFGEELRQASDPVVAFCARLEAAAPRSADSVLPFL
jgi:hypothetical protein